MTSMLSFIKIYQFVQMLLVWETKTDGLVISQTHLSFLKGKMLKKAKSGHETGLTLIQPSRQKNCNHGDVHASVTNKKLHSDYRTDGLAYLKQREQYCVTQRDSPYQEHEN